MSEEIQYEEVPQEDLQDHQRFFVNKEKEAPSWEGGATALAAKGLYKGAPAATRAVIDRIKGPGAQPQGFVTVQGAPENAIPPKNISTTVSEFHAPNMVSEHGFGPGAMKNVAHNVDMDLVNELHSEWAKNPVQGFEWEGNRRIVTPVSRTTTPSATPPAQMTPEVAEELRGLLTPTERALQAVRGMGSKALPYLEKADPYLRAAGLFGAGTTGMEAMKRFRHGDYGRGALDLIGMAGATAASLPVKNPLTTIGGAGVALSAEAINKLLDQYYGRDYATGGLVSLD